jgi:hypothetical protein
MSNQPKSKSLVGWSLAAVVLVALVLAVGLPGLRGEPESQASTGTETNQATASKGQRSTSMAGADGAPQSEEPAKPQETAPMPSCWAEMQRLDKELTLDNYRTALSAAASGGDRFLLTYLQERLTRMVGNDPQKALKVLSWAEETGEGVELMVYMESLKKTPAVQNPKVSGRLLQLAENPKSSLPLRAATVIGLETQKSFDAATLSRMKALALDGSAEQVAWNATRTIGRVLEEDVKNGGNYRPYWEQLLDISRESQDRAVRGLALEMPTYSNLVLDEKTIPALSEIMRTERDKEARELAAMRLSVTEAPQKALDAYRAAFPTETEFCVRWAFFRYALRAAGPAALPLVHQFAQQEPRLMETYLSFKEAYDQGMHDWERVFMEKGPTAHVECMDDHSGGQ